ncbi:MAG TPA: translation initiation factor IF-2 [Candidatus Saccharimonadales bacterium]|nr:translation initiation factor IF-2 [Candidatus Saccharimonadales bacterium]
MARQIEIDDQVTVGNLAELLSIPVSQLISELFKNGVAATVNEKIDFDTAQIIVGELPDVEVELTRKAHEPAPPRVKRDVSANAQSRPPVVAMMGHVDHGKTTLLDAIRGGSTASGEAGGITQHLAAYQIDHGGRLITFLDTPGHEAFAALREHGARLTDLVILVVAADDGIKPQTMEAIRFARQAGVKMIVAANKMDKATEAQLNMLKGQLAEQQLVPEDYGGDTIVIPVSAKEGTGIKELLDMVLLVSDVEEHKADKDVPATGLVIEAHMEQGRGPVAEALVEQGTLHAGDFVVLGGTYGKIRNLETTDGKPIKEAGPSTPVNITGLKNLPEFGDEFQVVKNEKQARDQSAQTAAARRAGASSAATSSSELLRIISRSNKLQEFNVVIKADVQGSITSVIDSLKTLDNEEVAVRVVSSGVGVISESDIHTAATSHAIIYGFHTSLPAHVKQLASRDKVQVRLFTVIYELIDDVKKELEAMLSPEVVEEELGTLQVKGIFKITKTEVICGGQVTKGMLRTPSLARVVRNKEVIADNLPVTKLQRGPTEVTEVPEGEMCGLSFSSDSRVEVQEDDRIEVFSRETRTRTL